DPCPGWQTAVSRPPSEKVASPLSTRRLSLVWRRRPRPQGSGPMPSAAGRDFDPQPGGQGYRGSRCGLLDYLLEIAVGFATTLHQPATRIAEQLVQTSTTSCSLCLK